MLEHDPNQQETTAVPNSPFEAASDTAYIAGYLDGYLDQICTPLKATMPEARSNEYRAEMLSHLEERIAAYQELGATPEQAVTDALRQFGSSGYIAHHWRQECERAVPTVTSEQSTRTALCYFGIAALMSSGLLLGTGDRINYTGGESLAFWLVFGLPLAAGSAVGLLADGRPVYGTLRALGKLFLPLLLFAQLWAHLQRFDAPGQAGAMFSAVQFIGWTLAGSLSAGACSLLRRACLRLRNRLALR